MFVRNNITCPNCGKVAPRDVFLDDSDTFDDFMLLKTECFECMGMSEALISYQDAMSFSLATTESLSYGDSRRRCHRWKRVLRLTSRRKAAIYSCLSDILGRGDIDWKFAEHWLLSSLNAMIIQSSGNPGQVTFFLPIPYRWYSL
jgi:hypothetical protein